MVFRQGGELGSTRRFRFAYPMFIDDVAVQIERDNISAQHHLFRLDLPTINLLKAPYICPTCGSAPGGRLY
jgi:hypothetical protein